MNSQTSNDGISDSLTNGPYNNIIFGTVGAITSGTIGVMSSGTCGLIEPQVTREQTSNLWFGTGLPPVNLSTLNVNAQNGASHVFPNHLVVGQKPKDFDGTDSKKWSEKLRFYLTKLKGVPHINEVPPLLTPEKDGEGRAAAIVDACTRNYFVNKLVDPLCKLYSVFKTSRDLWSSLLKKYKTEDAGTKNSVVEKFLDYKMVDSKTVVSQVEELQMLLHEMAAENVTLCETFQVAALIEKLPPGWEEFKNYLKHKRKAMSLENLIVLGLYTKSIDF